MGKRREGGQGERNGEERMEGGWTRREEWRGKDGERERRGGRKDKEAGWRGRKDKEGRWRGREGKMEGEKRITIILWTDNGVKKQGVIIPSSSVAGRVV